MAMQLQETVMDNVIMPLTSGVGYAKPSLEVLSCHTCNIKGGCLAAQLTIAHDHSYQVVKNKKVLAKGDHIYRGGDDAKAIFVVSSGSVKSYMLMENGEEQVLNFYMPGDVFGLDAMGGNCHVSSTIALENTTVCKLPLAGLQDRVLGQGFLNMIAENLLRDHNLMLMIDRHLQHEEIAAFAHDKIDPLMDTLQGVEPLKDEEITIEGGNPAYEFVYKWVPSENFIGFQKYLFIFKGGIGFTFSICFSKKSLKLLGSQVNDIIETLVPGTFKPLDDE